MRDLAECLFVLSLIFGIGIAVIYHSNQKFERCLTYQKTHPEMFGNSCKNFYR